ncbi:hypothetical protein BDM02DRAFT_1816935 [Thelephora ganbajun]|uniref:Uncharacterized protein n=1 Tax=Thelephora ganbajun TaxID=370292 RepID=A0ACB6Z0J8_THEGA|nr:hypothetical protein BDM02DRAFT_1816935 [Thelephora ganbajun]
MASPSSPALRRLHRLDASSPNFHDQLNNVLYGEEYVQCVSDLMNDDLVWLVDYLDNTLDRVGLSILVSRKCLRELRSICGTTAMLPTSYTLSTDLLKIDPSPFVLGCFGNLYRGSLNGSRACVKRMPAYPEDASKRAPKVCS